MQQLWRCANTLNSGSHGTLHTEMSDSENPFVEVPVSRLSPEALLGLVDEFVSREGTDYGDVVHSLEEKRESVLRQIHRGLAVIVFDPASKTCDILTKEELAIRKRNTSR